KAREGLRSVRTVIVDEVHALAGGKRGAHLALSLERLDTLGRAAQHRPVQRIGLSATVRPPEEVAAFLGGAQPVTIVQPPSDKQLDLRIVVPVEDMADLETAAPPPVYGGSGPASGEPGQEIFEPAADPVRRHSIWPHVEAHVLDLIESHKSTIVFANSRRLSERLCARLNELAAERIEEQQADAAAGLTAGQDGAAQYGSGQDGGAPGGAGRVAPAEVMAQAGASAGATAEIARAHHGSVSRQERAQI